MVMAMLWDWDSRRPLLLLLAVLPARRGPVVLRTPLCSISISRQQGGIHRTHRHAPSRVRVRVPVRGLSVHRVEEQGQEGEHGEVEEEHPSSSMATPPGGAAVAGSEGMAGGRGGGQSGVAGGGGGGSSSSQDGPGPPEQAPSPVEVEVEVAYGGREVDGHGGGSYATGVACLGVIEGTVCRW